ncbi:thioredoxin domain-containing protein [candidate division KSB1 bacterium]
MNIKRNNLDKALSSYLRSAKNQPVHWQEWSEKIFITAEELDKPILLDVGAVWCHWCHVMDRESYENDETAEIINSYFIPVKVDRDERPDVDRRYQTFIQALGAGGGWPLTGFLTPQGKLFYGGTYFPPENTMGRPGFKNVLLSISKNYHENIDQVFDNASEIFRQISDHEKQKFKPGDLDPDIIKNIISDIAANFDPIYGGLGNSQKFPISSALELAMLAFDTNKDGKFLDFVRITLDNMVKGGIHDHIGGGFHRYSVDKYWKVPHFEKMTSDNAEILINYLHFYQLTGEQKYKDTAEGIISYYMKEMTDQENGGFYAHQDADITLEDDGDYFTWTKAEIEEILDIEESEVFSSFYSISEKPHDLHNTPDRNVLYNEIEISSVAEKQGITQEKAETLLISAKDKLLTARDKRQAPFIDKTLYANLNGMMIHAYTEAYKVLKDDKLKEFALRTASLLIKKQYTEKDGFLHAAVDGTSHIRGLLSDQVWMLTALLDCYEISGDISLLETADNLAKIIIEDYEDKEIGGFFDRKPESNNNDVMSIPFKPYEDIPSTSANAVAITALNNLYLLTDNSIYRTSAKKALKAYAGNMKEQSTSYASGFGVSLFYLISPPIQVQIFGNKNNKDTLSLFEKAYGIYRSGKKVYIIDPDENDDKMISESIKSRIRYFNEVKKPVVFVCAGNLCAQPTTDPAVMQKTIEEFGRN